MPSVYTNTKKEALVLETTFVIQ